MSLFSGPEQHAANPPETWTVTKLGERCWRLATADGGELGHYKTRKAAEADKMSGFYVTLYAKEARWYAGEKVWPWRPYTEVRAGQQRGNAFVLGCKHGRRTPLLPTPYGDLDDAGSACLMDALGETEPTTEANHPHRVSLLGAYVRGWEKTSGRSYETALQRA